MKGLSATLGVGGCLALAVVLYVVGVLFWSLVISLVSHWVGSGWSWWWVCTHWGLLAPFVLG